MTEDNVPKENTPDESEENRVSDQEISGSLVPATGTKDCKSYHLLQFGFRGSSLPSKRRNNSQGNRF